MTWNDHDHRGQYAEDRHDHYREYAEYNHGHHDLDSLIAGLREDLRHAEARIRELEGDQAGMVAELRLLDRLRPTCVICRDAAADRQIAKGPACTDCVGDLPDGGPDPDRPETWAFAEVEDQAEEPEPEPYDPGPEVDDEGGMSEYRYVLPEDYQRGQS